MAIKTTNLYQREDYKLKLKQVEALLRQAKDVESLLARAESKINGKYDFSSHQVLRGNFLGNLLRGNKVSAVNNNIDRAQQALLDFHANLLLFDEKLANKISLPSKMSEFDITKAKRSMQAIVRRLESERKKAFYEISKEKELFEYAKDKNKGAL